MPLKRRLVVGILIQLLVLSSVPADASAVTPQTREESARIQKVFAESYPSAPEAVEGRLREMHGPEAKLYLAMLLHWRKPELRRPGSEIAGLLDQARSEAIDRTPRWSDRQASAQERTLGRLKPYDGTTASLIHHLRHSRGLISFQVPCSFFLRRPEIGAVARSLSLDRWRHGAIGVHCEEQLEDRMKSVFEIFAHRHPVNTIPCEGTIGRDIRAGQREARETLLYSPRDLATFSARLIGPGTTLRQTPLYNWAHLGRWNYRVFQDLEALYGRAVEELVAYLVEVFTLPEEEAQRIARLGLLTQLRGAKHWQQPTPTDSVRAAILEGREVDPEALNPDEDGPVVGDGGLWRRLSGDPEPLLFLAVDRPAVVQILLDRGFDPNVRNAFGKTALMAAAQAGKLESVRRLLAAGVDVEARTHLPNRVPDNPQEGSYGIQCGAYAIKHGRRTALMYAASEAPAVVVEALLAAGANPGARDSLGKSAADYLTGDGPMAANPNMSAPERTALARRLRELALTAPPDIDAPLNDLRQTALHLAVLQGETDALERLLREGAELDIVDGEGRTALALAAAQDRTDLMASLLEAGAGFDIRLQGGFGPLETAALAGARQAVTFLIDRGARLRASSYGGRRRLYSRLAQPDRLETVRRLLDGGLNHEQKKRLGTHAIHVANKDLLALLQANGLGLDGVPWSGRHSVAEVAVRSDQPHSLQALHDLGVDVPSLDSGSRPLLLQALKGGQFKALDKLLELGFDPFVGKRPEITALFVGVATARPELIDRALAAGARLDDRLDRLIYGGTVVHLALEARRLESLALLASRGADFNARNSAGKTPLERARGMRLGKAWSDALLDAGAMP